MTTQLAAPSVPGHRTRALAAPAALALAATVGVLIGAGTSFAQGGLHAPWWALADSASPWLAGSFVAGAVATRSRVAIGAGLLAGLVEVAAYYVTTAARGFAGSTVEIIFWTVCAIVGGPLFGGAGWAWRSAPSGRLRAIGAAALPATFLGEASGAYLLRLHYTREALLFACVGVACLALVALAAPRGRRVGAGRLLPAVAVLTVLGALVYGPLLAGAGIAAFGG